MSLCVENPVVVSRHGISCNNCGRTIRVPMSYFDRISMPPDAEMRADYMQAEVAQWISERHILNHVYALCHDCRGTVHFDERYCLHCDQPTVGGTHFCVFHVCQKKMDGIQCRHARMCDYAMCPEHVQIQMLSGCARNHAHLIKALQERVKI